MWQVRAGADSAKVRVVLQLRLLGVAPAAQEARVLAGRVGHLLLCGSWGTTVAKSCQTICVEGNNEKWRKLVSQILVLMIQ